MPHAIKQFLQGFGFAGNLLPPPRGYRVEQSGFAVDARNLRGDFAAVGGDMRKALKRNQQANKRPRKG